MPEGKRCLRVYGLGIERLELEGSLRGLEVLEIECKETRSGNVHSKSTRMRVSFREAMNQEINLPQHFNSLSEELKRFRDDHPYEKTAFIMMKFPDRKGEGVKDKVLDNIFKALRSCLQPYSITAVRADGKHYSRQLWDNVCIYMLGSKYGVAILESKYKKELNPNVAQEYGFMNALGRQIVLFEEEGFELRRADMLGTISERFKWSRQTTKLNKSIKKAVEKWMIDLGIQKTSNI